MFRSLTSLIFGSNTSEITKQEQENNQKEPNQLEPEQLNATDTANTIELTSSTPSVSGENSIKCVNKRGKNSRNNNRRKGKKQQQQQQQRQQDQANKSSSDNKKLSTLNDDNSDEDIDEDDWLIVEKECEEDDHENILTHAESKEEDLSIDEDKPTLVESVVEEQSASTSAVNAAAAAAALRHRHNICTHSLYSGPRPQQQRNYLQRARNSGARSGRRLSASALSPPRIVGGASDGGNFAIEPVAADVVNGGVTQSLYAAPPLNISGGSSNDSGNESLRNPMEESWFVTPPSCFTSIGPIHMETSPFENLLIEHPSMSVYYSIRSAQEAAESFVSLDLGVKSESQAKPEEQEKQKAALAEKNSAAGTRRTAQARLDRYSITQLKQELLARNNQKSHDMQERRQSVCRGAIKRANKARDYQSKSNRQRRSEMQHFKLISGYNNNRKSSKQQKAQKSSRAA